MNSDMENSNSSSSDSEMSVDIPIKNKKQQSKQSSISQKVKSKTTENIKSKNKNIEEKDEESKNIEDNDNFIVDEEVNDDEITSGKKKLTINEILSELKIVCDNETSKEKELDLLYKQEKALKKELAAYRRHKTRILNKFFNGNVKKAYEIEIIKEKKEKKQKNKRVIKKTPVPNILKQFLNLNDDDLYTRSEIYSLLNNKFKELGLKTGQVITLDKSTAAFLQKEEGYTITFKNFLSFISSYYVDLSEQI